MMDGGGLSNRFAQGWTGVAEGVFDRDTAFLAGGRFEDGRSAGSCESGVAAVQQMRLRGDCVGVRRKGASTAPENVTAVTFFVTATPLWGGRRLHLGKRCRRCALPPQPDTCACVVAVLECGGKGGFDAARKCHGRDIFCHRHAALGWAAAASWKAVSPLRSATAVRHMLPAAAGSRMLAPRMGCQGVGR